MNDAACKADTSIAKNTLMPDPNLITIKVNPFFVISRIAMAKKGLQSIFRPRDVRPFLLVKAI